MLEHTDPQRHDLHPILKENLQLLAGGGNPHKGKTTVVIIASRRARGGSTSLYIISQ